MSKNKYLVVLLAALIGTSANAKQLWSDTSISLLKGSNYEVGDDEKTVMTLEHASGHTWGSTFTFVDRLHDENLGGNETYGEILASYNVYSQQNSVLKDVYVAGHMEFGSNPFNNFNNYLYGVGANLNIPKANYFNITYFRRNNDLYDDNNQITLVWSFPLVDSIVFDGFSDIADSNDDVASQYNITSQLKYDIGQHLGVTKGHLYAGVEYTYWHNKFGIDGITEKNANLLIKWHL